MKKRLLSALLALALVFVLLPTAALAGETTYSDSEITISGKYWNFGKKGTSGEYAPVYFRSNGTAFEESKPTGSNYLEIKKTGEKEITITVYGTVNLTENESSTNSCISVNSNGVNERNLIITGAAKGSTLNLTCKNNSHPLYSYEGSITINGGVTVNATSQCSNNNNYVSVYGIQVYKGGHNLTISGANTKVNVANKTYDSTVKVDGNITVSDGAQLKAENKSGKVTGNTSKKAYAIECGGQLSISGDKTQVTAYTSNGKKAISGTVNNGDKLTFKAANSKGSQIFLQRPMDEALGYAYVEITQAPTDPYVFIAGEPAIMGQETPIPGGSGTYLYKKTPHDGSFLTLKGVDITGTKDGPARFIQFGKNGGYYTIQLEGENKISGFSSGIVAPEDPGVNDVTVVLSGSGSLDITANQYAIDMQVGKLKFENTGTIKLTTGHNYVKPLNALHVAGSIFIDKAKYDIVGVKQDKDGTREDISDNPNLETILKGTSTDEDLYFKSITITPAAAKDSTIRYNGTTLKQGETIKDGKGGTATVDRENNTITLDNFKGNYPLEFNAEFTPNSIILIGDSTLSAVETKYQNLTISGSGSLTVGSIKVHNQKTSSDDKPNLTINGATVTVGTAELTTRAIDIDGDLTVTGASLTATSASDSVPTVQVGGNASFTGSTVTITNKSTTQGKQYEDSNAASSALHVNGAVTISGGTVTAEAKAGGNAIRAVGNITVSNDATVTAKNNSQYFNAITAGRATGGEVNTLYNLIVSGENTRITATNAHDNNLTYGGAINAYIKNANEGHYLQVGTDTKAIAPNVKTTVRNNSLTITRGDAYTTPQVAANYTIAGRPMYVGKYYKTDANGNITDGTAQDYNIYCDSENDFTLNNATISSTGTGGSTGVIMTNLNASSNEIHIKLIGTNSINNAGHHAILGEGAYSTIFIENAENASNASLTISGNYLPVYSYGNVTINAEVVIKNTNGNLISTNKDGHANGAFDLGSGYKCYASTSTTGNLLEEFNSANYSTYKYLRVTTLTLETGGGSTCQHDWDEAWHDTGDGHHAHQCTKCQAFDTAHQQAHDRLPDESKGLDKGHTLKCGLCGYKYDQSIIESHVWSGWETFEQYFQLGDHAQRCNCGQLGHRHLKGELVYRPLDSEYHQQICSVEGCGYPGRTSKSEHVYEENSDICKYCGYDKSAPCDHTGDLVYTNNGDGTHKVTCNACGATIVEKQNHEFNHTGACIYCGATQSGGDPTPDNPGTIVIIRPAEEEKPAQQPNPSTGANDLVGLAVAAAVAAALGSAALLRKHD